MGIQINGTNDTISATDNSLSVVSSESTFSGISTFTSNLVVTGSTSNDLVRITQTGSGNALVVEDSANPDSTPFVVNASGSVGIGTDSPVRKLDVHSGSSSDIVRFTNDSGTTLTFGATSAMTTLDAPASTGFRFRSGGSSGQHFTISSTGNIGIGTDNPIMRLHVHGDANDASSRIRLSSAEGSGLTIRAQSATESNINVDSGEFLSFTVGNTEGFRMNSSGNIAFVSGNGIDFSASATDGATVDSEILSDYEEGEWTPTLGGSTSDPTFTLGNNRCRYIKIGRLVIAQMDFDGTISGAGNGQLEASLPFAVANPSPKPYCDIFGARNCSMIAAETYKVTGWTVEGTSRARFSLSTGTDGAETIVSWGVNVNTGGTPRLCAAFAYYSTT